MHEARWSQAKDDADKRRTRGSIFRTKGKCWLCGNMAFFPAGKNDVVHGLAGYMNEEARNASWFIEQAKKKKPTSSR